MEGNVILSPVAQWIPIRTSTPSQYSSHDIMIEDVDEET